MWQSYNSWYKPEPLMTEPQTDVFDDELAIIKASPCFDHRKLLLSHYMQTVKKNFGLILDFGVWHGAFTKAIAKLSYPRTVYGFDWWKGLPEDWGTWKPKGHFALKQRPKPPLKNVKFIGGLIQKTLPRFLKKNTSKCALVHIDTDLYSTAHCILQLLHNDRRLKNTVIVLDEYQYGEHLEWKDHEAKAWHEMKDNYNYEYLGWTKNGRVAILIK